MPMEEKEAPREPDGVYPSLYAKNGLVLSLNSHASALLEAPAPGQSLESLLGFPLAPPAEGETLRFYGKIGGINCHGESKAEGEGLRVNLYPQQPVPRDLPHLMLNVESMIRRRLAVVLPNLDMLERQLSLDDGTLPEERLAKAGNCIAELRRNGFALLNLCETLQSKAAGLLEQTRVRYREAELTALLRSVCEHTQAALEDLGISVSGKIPKEALPAFLDGDMLETVLYELLSNAALNSSAGQEIGVSLTQEGEEVLLQVRDMAGKAPLPESGELLEGYRNCSLPAIRLNLGMPLVSSFAESHGGRLLLASGTGHNTVTLRFPLRREGEGRGLEEEPCPYDSGYPKPLVALAGVAPASGAYLRKNFSTQTR